jgi:hypothetical protein
VIQLLLVIWLRGWDLRLEVKGDEHEIGEDGNEEVE